MSSKDKNQGPNINEAITASEVRLIDAEGNQAGIVSLNVALNEASSAGLDLVEISPNADPPVCRIMDYGKFLFEQNKKRSEAKKKQKVTHVKEIKLRPGTDIGDYNVKLKKIAEFLEKGDKVKITVRFRGREMAHKELGNEMLDRVVNDLVELGDLESRPNLEGRQMMMIMAPKRKTKK